MIIEDYYEEMRERGRIAKSAHAKKHSPRRPKINSFTNKEWEKMNGEVVQYNLAKPMTWEELLALSDSAQREYVQKLISTYDIGTTALSVMFGVSTPTCSKYVRNTLNLVLTKYSSQKNNQRFIDEFCGQKEETLTAPQNVEELSNAASATKDIPVAVRSGTAMRLDRTSLEFSGAFNADAIVKKLSVLFDEGTKVHILIEIETVE